MAGGIGQLLVAGWRDVVKISCSLIAVAVVGVPAVDRAVDTEIRGIERSALGGGVNGCHGGGGPKAGGQKGKEQGGHRLHGNPQGPLMRPENLV